MIYKRCEQLRRDAEKASQETSTGTSLVLASLYATELDANKQYLAVHHSDLRSGKSRERAAGDGWYDGYAHGTTISLNRQVGTTSSTHKRLS